MKKLIFLFFLCIGAALYGQNKTVTGVVNDDAGYPMPGAFILQQGTSNGAMTDIDGIYEIKVPEGAVLVVSCMGFLEQQVTVGASNRYDFNLATDALMMEEAVVVGYGTQKAKDLTAPIVNVKGDELNKQISGNALSALQGKASGVRIIQSGAPGAAPSVTIRGTGSIGSYATPLYVVDGVFVDNISFIATSDIEEMTVLKDASAAAIYGVRAANGVILITTKKGTMDHTDISYDGYVGMQVPVNVMKLANREQYVEILNEAFADDASYTPKNAANYPASTDWYATLLRKALTHSHSLDVSGATEKTNYSFGLNYFYQDGIMNVDNGYDRVNLRGRVDQKVKDWLTMGMNVLVSDYNRKDPNSGAFEQAFVNPPIYPVYNDANTDAYPVNFDSPQRYGFGGSYGNPFAAVYYSDNRTKGLNLVFSTYAEIKLMRDKLKFKTAYNFDYEGYKSESYTPEFCVYGTQSLSTSSMSKTFGLRRKQILDNTLTYADSRGKHSFSALLGQSTRIENLTGLWGSATDVPDVDAQSRYIGLGSTKNIGVTDLTPGPYTYHGLSFFSRGTWNYADRFLATATFRADASSKYQQKWGFFPSVGAGWVLTEEDFMKNLPAFEYLKFRASWGLLGNDNVPANSASIVGSSGYNASAVFNGVIVDGVGAQTVYQNYLKWEVVSEWDLGFDFAFLQSRLSGTLDYYNRTTHNVVFYVPIATGGGTTELLANNGTVRNSGFELDLHWNDRITDDLSYNVGLNVTTVRNRVVALEGRDYIPGAEVRGVYSTRTVVGYPIGSFWGYEIDGVWSSNKEAMLDDQQQTVKGAGFFKYKDQDGNQKIDDKDLTYLGSPIPWLQTGLDFGLGWKNFDFSVSFYGQFGNKILNAKRMNRGTFSDGNYDLDFYENRWTKEHPSDKYPSAAAYGNSYVQRANDFFVEPGWFVRIQNIQAGYTFTKFGKMDFVSSARVYVAAQRPFSYFTYNGFTTEIGGSPIASGIDTSTHPLQAIYTLGVKLNFK